MKSDKMIEIDNLVEQWQTTKDEQVAKKLFDKVKGWLNTKGNDDTSISDAYYSFARALDTWEAKKGIYFIYWLKLLWTQERNERMTYLTRKKRSGMKSIPLDAEYGTREKNITVAEMIVDENEQLTKKQKENKEQLMEFLNSRADITERERLIMENIYLEKGKFQTDIAKEMGISQVMVHKTIKNIHKKPYADDLYKLLKELMGNG